MLRFRPCVTKSLCDGLLDRLLALYFGNPSFTSIPDPVKRNLEASRGTPTPAWSALFHPYLFESQVALDSLSRSTET